MIILMGIKKGRLLLEEPQCVRAAQSLIVLLLCVSRISPQPGLAVVGSETQRAGDLWICLSPKPPPWDRIGGEIILVRGRRSLAG